MFSAKEVSYIIGKGDKMNSVILIGRLTKKPELEYTAGNTAVTKFSIAVDRKDEGADFIRITVFGKQAESICRYMDTGRQVAVEGRIQTGSYEDRNTGKKVYTTDVIANRVEFLGSREEPKKEEPRYHNRYSDDLF